jgi:hypothetical protein
MSDPTKKSIVINKAFLSGSENSGSSRTQNKKSKKNTRNLSEEIIKPNKLKKMLLDKINAKRKAEQTSSVSSFTGDKADTLDISKETKIFSSEFKKSLDFLDSYIGQKRSEKNNNKTKTLKKQSPLSPSTSLNSDILKSLHTNTTTNTNTTVANTHASQPSHASHSPNNINQSIPPQRHITQAMLPRPQQHIATPVVAPQTPLFQKIELQIPNKPIQNAVPTVLPNTVPKINLAIGKPKTDSSTFVYTELPDELQNFTPPVYNISSPVTVDSLPPLDAYHKPIDVIDSREMGKLDYNNSESLDAHSGIKNDMNEMNDMNDTGNIGGGLMDVEISNTSLLPTSTTFSPIKLSDDTPYGCLKGGKKPTFRTYNKTIKNNFRFSDNNNDNGSNFNSDNVYSDRQAKLKDLQNKHNKNTLASSSSSSDNNKKTNFEGEDDTTLSEDNENKKNRDLRKTKIRKKFRKTITKKFKLGKQPGSNVVGVLIKNNDTRKNIQKEHGLLKSKQLGEIKKYLVDKNLIKIGSTAPPGVIRNIYEASMLSGEVENIGKGIGLHNFLEDKKAW